MDCSKSGMTLQDRIAELCERHGSLRAAARATKVDVAYMSRLARGEKIHPSPLILKRLGVRQVVSYFKVSKDA